MIILDSLESAHGLPISANWTFSLGFTAEALRGNVDWKSAILLKHGPFGTKLQVEGVAPTNHSFPQKTRLNDISYGVKIWTDFFRFLTIHAFVRRADGWTDRQNSHR